MAWSDRKGRAPLRGRPCAGARAALVAVTVAVAGAPASLGQLQGGARTSAASCAFPFVYGGVTHTQCTSARPPGPRAVGVPTTDKLWCATKVGAGAAYIKNYWGFCAPGSSTQTDARPCVFPFEAGGVLHTSCTTYKAPGDAYTGACVLARVRRKQAKGCG